MTRLLLLTALLAAASLADAQTVPMATSSDVAKDHYVLATERMAHIDFDGARAHLDAAIETDPQFARAHVWRAFLSPPAAQTEHLRHAQAARPSGAAGQLVEALAVHLDGDHAREIEILTALHEQHPDDLDVVTWLGNELYNQERYDEAAAVLRHGAATNPTDGASRNMLGYTLMRSGDRDGAEEAFLDYIRVAPDEGNPYDSYGEFLLGEGRLDEAEVQFKKALVRDPDLAASARQLVQIAMERSDLRLERGVADGDADAVAALYAENAVVMAPGVPRLRGRDAIRDHMAGMMGAGVDGADIQTVNVLHFDDWAVRESNIVLRSGGQVVDRLKAMELWRHLDGEWLYVRDMYSSDGPEATAGTQ